MQHHAHSHIVANRALQNQNQGGRPPKGGTQEDGMVFTQTEADASPEAWQDDGLVKQGS